MENIQSSVKLLKNHLRRRKYKSNIVLNPQLEVIVLKNTTVRPRKNGGNSSSWCKINKKTR